MKTWLKLLLVIVSVFGLVSSAQAMLIYQAGLMDDFGGGSDPSNPSAALMASVGANIDHSQNTHLQIFQDFDLTAGINSSNNRAVGHTFTALPSQIASATFDIRVRAGLDPWTISDGLFFSFVESATDIWVDKIAWHRDFFEFNNGTWEYGDDLILSLDLAALPLLGGGTINLIPMIEQYGFLDAMVEDETGVDYMTLRIQPVPEPATILLLSVGFVGGLVEHRRKQKRIG